MAAHEQAAFRGLLCGRLKFRPPVPLRVVMRRYRLIFKPHVEGQIFLRDLQLSPAHALTSRSLELEHSAVLASWSDVDLNARNVGPYGLIPSIRDRALLRPIVSLWRHLRNAFSCTFLTEKHAYGVRSQTGGIARQKRWFRPNEGAAGGALCRALRRSSCCCSSHGSPVRSIPLSD
jgi:hypothetical protein